MLVPERNFRDSWLRAEEDLSVAWAERDTARAEVKWLREALTRLANLEHTPLSEEAALLQIEVEQIAQAALDA